MRNSRLGHALLLLIALATLPSVTHAQDTTLQSIITGNQTPLALTFKDLDATWCRLSFTGASSAQDAYAALYTSDTPGQYYTQGHTTIIGGVTYLVAYRVPAKPLDLNALIRTPGQALPKPSPVTPDTSLALCLLDMRSPGSFNDIQAFSLTQALAPAPPSPLEALGTTRQHAENIMSESNLKQLSLGILQYTQDFDEKLPPLDSPAAFKKAVIPYVKTDSLFIQPTVNKPYALNTSLAKRSLATFAEPAAMVMMCESTPMPDGTRAICFLDGHVKRFPEAQWPALKRASHVPDTVSKP